mgnify:CR=1 FL=1
MEDWDFSSFLMGFFTCGVLLIVIAVNVDKEDITATQISQVNTQASRYSEFSGYEKYYCAEVPTYMTNGVPFFKCYFQGKNKLTCPPYSTTCSPAGCGR